MCWGKHFWLCSKYLYSLVNILVCIANSYSAHICLGWANNTRHKWKEIGKWHGCQECMAAAVIFVVFIHSTKTISLTIRHVIPVVGFLWNSSFVQAWCQHSYHPMRKAVFSSGCPWAISACPICLLLLLRALMTLFQKTLQQHLRLYHYLPHCHAGGQIRCRGCMPVI